jgi:superfamily II DNA or RNA helicase
MVLSQFPFARCLVVVPSVNLVNNLHKAITKEIKEKVGRIGGGREEWGRITISTGKSLLLHAKGKYAEELKEIGVLIFDECHNFGNATGIAISDACVNTAYRLGLSATVTRENGSDIVLEGVIGPRALTIPDTVMVNLDVIHRPQLYFIDVPSPKLRFKVSKGNSKPERNDVYTEGLVNYEHRNRLVIDIVNTFLNSENYEGLALVLVERIAHGELLQKMFAEQELNVPYIHGSSGKERQEIIEQFRQGKLRCILASRILNEGEDVPLLELVVNAAGGSGKRGIIQKTGRGLRKDSTGIKKQAIIVDFYDHEPNYLRSNSDARIRNISERHPNCVTRWTSKQFLAFLQGEKRMASSLS